MTTAAEAAAGSVGSNPQLAAVLAAGLENLSGDQVVTFVPYYRVVLPISGFIFWVKTPNLGTGSSGALNASPYNAAVYNGVGPAGGSALAPITAKGSIHISTLGRQEEASSAAQNQIVFTSEQYLEPLNADNPSVLWIGTFPPANVAGSPRRFAFRESTSHYRQSNLWHYRGDAIYSTMQTQIVDSLAQIATLEPVVNDSLPIWLANPPAVIPGQPLIPVFPSFAVPPNTPPPYVAVHIPPESTRAIQANPLILAADSSSWQLAEEWVHFTAYGLQNNGVIDYQNQLLQLAEDDACPFGVMQDIPIWSDHKQTQVELQVLAQKKTFSMRVSYYQSRVMEIARQLILSCELRFTVPNTNVAVTVTAP